MADGSTVSFSPDRSLEVAVLQETRRDYLVQMEESAGGLAGKTAVRYD
jgi:hypothetical protein